MYPLINSLKYKMLKYQKNHNIKNKCVSNCQYFYNTINEFNLDIEIKTKSVIVIYTPINSKTTNIISGHLVIMINGCIYEVSYDVYKNRNLSDFKYLIEEDEICDFIYTKIHPVYRIYYLRTYEDFNNVSKYINTTDDMVIENIEYYSKIKLI